MLLILSHCSVVKYIREGTAPHQFALIRVIVRNEGSEAYLPNTYGKKIIVERKITKEGSGSYVLKSANGQVITRIISVICTWTTYDNVISCLMIVSREKKVLLLMLSTFNIQVDNPCCVLTQEESKKFIQGSDKEKFNFFMKVNNLLLDLSIVIINHVRRLLLDWCLVNKLLQCRFVLWIIIVQTFDSQCSL